MTTATKLDVQAMSKLTPRNEIRFLAEAVLESLEAAGITRSHSCIDANNRIKVDLLAIINITEHEL